MSTAKSVAEEAISSTTTESITRTIPLRLETSDEKNDFVQMAINDFQRMTSYVADILPSFPEHEWSQNNNQIDVALRRELGDSRVVCSDVRQEAYKKVVSSYNSWKAQGSHGNRPQFDDVSYFQMKNCNFDIIENDRGWGVKARFIPYNPVWFHIDAGPYEREFLERITDEDDDARAGGSEIRLNDDGSLQMMLTVSWDVDVYKPADIDTVVGVDLNEDPIVAIAVVDPDGTVADVEMERGREYRHVRERIKKQRADAMSQGKLREVKSAKYDYKNYTDHITNVVSRRVVDCALEHEPAVIQLEDLTHYRETAKNPIHDWPYAEIQDKIAYKATEEGIPVEFIDPRCTSITCRKCGSIDRDDRNGREFHCSECGYEVHADVNAAINIANSEPK